MNKFNKTILSSKNGRKSASGITLIALVITIIVLLILAGVTIAQLTGSDSAPAKANEAKQKNDIGSARDQVYLFASNAQTEAYETVYVKGKKTDNSGDDVTAGGAGTEVSNYVKNEIKKEYASNKNKKVGLASIVSSADGSTITISTTDFEETGTISATGGTLSWSGIVGKTAQGTTPQTSTTKKMNEITLSNIQLEVGNTHTIALPANTEDIASCSCSDSAISVTNAGVITANGATSGAVVTITGVSGQSTTVTVIVQSTQQSLTIGDTVNYSTSLNGVDLTDWRVFYIDGDYTYIIYDDYLPNNAINSENIGKNGNYSVYGNNDAESFMSEMLNSANWDSLLIENKNGTAINHKDSSDSNIKALGSPTLELWVNSWNSSYPENTIYTEETTSAISDSIKGYKLGLSKYKYQNPIDPSEPYRDNVYGYAIQLSNSEKDNKLYFPYTTAIDKYVEEEYEEYRCDGYWLASVTAYDGCYIFSVDYRGWIGDSGCRLGIL